ncbi:hypothetical protein MUN82_03995 [Hymenobacter aerilatus]|uniref:Uncharacterized protein n=1 Tax=Hymenobacter aerilatus TaxID=2932251 RepID=A0A8T9SY00_9BACT|nr:hypothetical protein [Hymenobacter aerilatus]UOR06261.1 hypothetical protein MUN82_03995 [Hymenobacter aerilatus]
MSLCQNCIARLVDTDDRDRTRAVLVRWAMKRRGFVTQDTMTDEELLSRQDPRIQDARQDADEIICLLIGIKARFPAEDPPF